MQSLVVLTFLLAAVPSDGPITVLQLARGQELVYSGICESKGTGSTSTSRGRWDLSVRIFVLETADDKAEVAILTTCRQSNDQAASRLVLADVDYLGRIKPQRDSWIVPFDTPATVETAAFIDLPVQVLAAGAVWEVNESDRPPRRWSVQGHEHPKNGPRCLKVLGEQITTGWNEIGAHRQWRRRDTVLLDPRTGIVRHLDRTIELRDPSRKEVTNHLTTHLELESSLVIPDGLSAERRAEISLAIQADQSLADQNAPASKLDSLQRRLQHHLDQRTPTAYREAVAAALRKVQAFRNGERQPEVRPEKPRSEIAVGMTIPDFIAPDLTRNQLIRVNHESGRGTVLVFFRHDSSLAVPALKAASEVRSKATVLGLCVSDDAAAAMRLTESNHVQIPLCDGREVASRYAVLATPRFVVLDENGVIRLVVDGFGSEVGALLAKTVEAANSTP